MSLPGRLGPNVLLSVNRLKISPRCSCEGPLAGNEAGIMRPLGMLPAGSEGRGGGKHPDTVLCEEPGVCHKRAVAAGGKELFLKYTEDQEVMCGGRPGVPPRPGQGPARAEQNRRQIPPAVFLI